MRVASIVCALTSFIAPILVYAQVRDGEPQRHQTLQPDEPTLDSSLKATWFDRDVTIPQLSTSHTANTDSNTQSLINQTSGPSLASPGVEMDDRTSHSPLDSMLAAAPVPTNSLSAE